MYDRDLDIEYLIATRSIIKYCADWDCYFIDHKCRVWYHGEIISNNVDVFISKMRKERQNKENEHK